MSKRISSRQGGFSLIELMVALAIGSLLIAGAVYVYSQSRNTYAVNETVARLQENGRYVMSLIEPELQLAGYYGFTNAPNDFKYIRNGSTGSPVLWSGMRAVAPAVAGLGTTHACRTNYAVDLVQTIEGSNDVYTLGCAGLPSALAATDTLTIRRAATNLAAAPVAGRLQVLVSRLSPNNQFILADGLLPATPALEPNLVELRDLIVESFYVSPDSNTRVGLPTLRRKMLIDGPAIRDDEIMPGVQDLQIQFGIDTGDYNGDGIIDAGLDSDGNGIPDVVRGIATRYVNPNFANIDRYQVVSVRIWLLMRAEQPETGFSDARPYVYAGKNFTPADGFRRVLMSRTIQLRNSRAL